MVGITCVYWLRKYLQDLGGGYWELRQLCHRLRAVLRVDVHRVDASRSQHVRETGDRVLLSFCCLFWQFAEPDCGEVILGSGVLVGSCDGYFSYRK